MWELGLLLSVEKPMDFVVSMRTRASPPAPIPSRIQDGSRLCISETPNEKLEYIVKGGPIGQGSTSLVFRYVRPSPDASRSRSASHFDVLPLFLDRLETLQGQLMGKAISFFGKSCNIIKQLIANEVNEHIPCRNLREIKSCVFFADHLWVRHCDDGCRCLADLRLTR
jgi:hypothetical protein